LTSGTSGPKRIAGDSYDVSGERVKFESLHRRVEIRLAVGTGDYDRRQELAVGLNGDAV
jgi:hypothetical protein